MTGTTMNGNMCELTFLLRKAAQEGPRDDQVLNLRGAFVNLGDFGVAIVALHREFGGVPVATVNLHGFGRMEPGCRGREQFGLTRRGGGGFRGVAQSGG